jgi:drug/metabolite transporter (DMT)-like permease
VSASAYGIPLALATTSAFNMGLILEKRALTSMSALNVRKVGHALASLLSNPAWLAGFALMLTGMACQVVVLTFEPISLVQPILASGVALTLVLSRLLLRERLGGGESWCVAALAVSLVLLAFSQDATGRNTTQPPSMVAMVAAIVPSLAAGLLITTWPRRVQRRQAHGGTEGGAGGMQQPTTATGICAGIGTGLLYGVSALMTKGLSGVLNREHTAVSIGLGLISSPYLYLLAGCSAAALLLYQAALQACRASILVPITNVVSSVYFLIAGTWLFHEQLPANPVRLGLRLAGIVAAGLVIIALSRQAPSQRGALKEAPSQRGALKEAPSQRGALKEAAAQATPQHAAPKHAATRRAAPRHATARDAHRQGQ